MLVHWHFKGFIVSTWNISERYLLWIAEQWRKRRCVLIPRMWMCQGYKYLDFAFHAVWSNLVVAHIPDNNVAEKYSYSHRHIKDAQTRTFTYLDSQAIVLQRPWLWGNRNPRRNGDKFLVPRAEMDPATRNQWEPTWVHHSIYQADESSGGLYILSPQNISWASYSYRCKRFFVGHSQSNWKST